MAAQAAAAEAPRELSPEERSPDTPLLKVLRNTPASALEPYHFFVSWQGVLTLAYSGFPAALETLKSSLAEVHPCLPAENPGARWPKTSLGCLRDGARLTPQQLAALKDACTRWSAGFGAGECSSMLVDRAAVVLYECRSLERCVSCVDVPLARPHYTGPDEEGRPSAAAAAYVRGVVREWDAPGYWFHASKDGNREAHYRGPHLGATLVHWLLCARLPPGHSPLMDAVRGFRQEVDALLPGLYCWFDDASLHVTLRNIKD